MRILVTETLDPDGAMARWATPDLTECGHEALALPTQELVALLGPDGLRAFLLSVVREWRPDFVLLCPPYEHLGQLTLTALSELGSRPVAFAFDEPLFGERTISSAWHVFDHVFVTCPDSARRLSNQGLDASWIQWAASVKAFGTGLDPRYSDRVLLVGRAYQRRVELVSALAARGLKLQVHGHGWAPHAGRLQSVGVGGPLSGPEMHAALRGAGAVITTGDWEDQQIPMVKYRLLEAALCGAKQVAQESPDLHTYFTTDEVCRYQGLGDLECALRDILDRPVEAARRAEKARLRAISTHSWTTRIEEILNVLGHPEPRSVSPSVPSSYVVGLALIAHDAERRGALALAASAFGLWASLTADATAHAGLARIARQEGASTTVATHAARAFAKRSLEPHTADGLFATVPTSVGTGLGLVGYLDPRPEFIALELSARISANPESIQGHLEQLIEAPDLLVAVAAILVPTFEPREIPAWHDVFRAALEAAPLNHVHLAQAHAPRWRRHLDELAVLSRPC